MKVNETGRISQPTQLIKPAGGEKKQQERKERTDTLELSDKARDKAAVIATAEEAKRTETALAESIKNNPADAAKIHASSEALLDVLA